MKKMIAMSLCFLLMLSASSALAYVPGTYTGEGDGMGGKVVVEVTFSKDAMTDVKVVSHHETPSIGSEAVDRLPAAILKAQSADVDIVSGATITSVAILKAVEEAIEQAESEEEPQLWSYVLGVNPDGTFDAFLCEYLGKDISEIVLPETLDGMTVAGFDQEFGTLMLRNFTDGRYTYSKKGCHLITASYGPQPMLEFFSALAEKGIPVYVTATENNEIPCRASKLCFELKGGGEMVHYGLNAEKTHCSKCGKDVGAPARIPGDVTDDGKVDGRDALRLNRYLAGQGVTINEKASDVNGDGKVDGRDALRLTRFLAGQAVELK